MATYRNRTLGVSDSLIAFLMALLAVLVVSLVIILIGLVYLGDMSLLV